MFTYLKKFFQKKSLKDFVSVVREIDALEEEVQKLTDEELTARSIQLRQSIQVNYRNEGLIKNDVIPQAFALAREASRRTLNQRPFEVQLIGGLVLHKGAVAEMATGEGKTLTAVAPAYLNALTGAGVHMVTVNEYLARRDAVWMGQIYRMLGLSVACLVPNAAYIYDPTWRIPETTEGQIDKERDETGNFLVQQEYLRPISRREAYAADITYGTNHEFGFDYLRDNLSYNVHDQVQRGHVFAIIDEVDSILIDEARTPLIISAPDAASSDLYKTFARFVRTLVKDEDYTVDEKFKSVHITEPGIGKAEKVMGVGNIYAPENLRLVHYLEESLKAHALFQKDKDYVVKNGEIVIVDEFTGRLLAGRRYNGGLHQAIEAKEGVLVKEESRTYGKVSIQNYFRLYKKISGMTGTAQTSAEEFHKVYGLEVFSIPSNRKSIRIDEADAIYKNADAKLQAIVEDIELRHRAGQPVLVGTTSIANNETVSRALSQKGVRHEVLNAKNNEREGAIIAQAGRRGAVTVATNLAGRGVDIILGGNPPNPQEAKDVRDRGGLHVIGTQRHEARRIDNQLRGRAGRQGDPGSSQFYLGLDDDLMRIFGGDRIKNMMERFQFPENEPIKMPIVSRAVAEAQAKVEGAHFDSRKHLLEYDDVLNKQRGAVYKKRQEILGGGIEKEFLATQIKEATNAHIKKLLEIKSVHGHETEDQEDGEKKDSIEEILKSAEILDQAFDAEVTGVNDEELQEIITQKSLRVVEDPQTRGRMLSILDMLWMNHLDDLEAVSESIGLRAYGQRDPLVEYRREAHILYMKFWENFNEWVAMNVYRTANAVSATQNNAEENNNAGEKMPTTNIKPAVIIPQSNKNESKQYEGVGRNDVCPCGSGKKYKKCHGK